MTMLYREKNDIVAGIDDEAKSIQITKRDMYEITEHYFRNICIF